MADVVFIAVALGFFGLCALYVHWCDRIIDADHSGLPADAAVDTLVDVDAGVTP